MIKNIGISLICIMLMISNIFVFSTLPAVCADSFVNICPVAVNPTIVNQSEFIDVDVGWFNITVYDDDGNNTFGNITCSNGDTSFWSNQSNGTKSLELDILDYNTNYTVWLNFTDGICIVNNIYCFVTASNNAPIISGEDPVNGSTSALMPICNVTVNDAESESMTVTWQSNYSDGVTWVTYEVDNSVTSGSSPTWSFTGAVVYSKVHWWRVWADDGTSNVSNIYHFTTIVAPPATSVNVISPYWQNGVPEVVIRATNNSVKTDSITLYYRFSSNNATWGNWTFWSGVNNPREDIDHTPWVWTFDCPSDSGYYQFYSIGERDGSYEAAPGSYDACCRVTKTSWNRFGYYPVGSTSDTLGDTLQGSNFICPTSGIADNMTVWLENGGLTANVKCAIYSSDRSTLIGYTEEKTLGSVYNGWTIFNFTGEPFLLGGNQYWLMVWGDGGHTRFDYDNSYDIAGQYGYVYTGTFPASIVSLPLYPDKVLSLYCRYTPLSKPVNLAPSPANASINMPLTPGTLNITVYDPDGYPMDITFCTNESGTWKNAGTNISVDNGTYYCLNTSWINDFSTRYWWSVNTSDGHGNWDNDTYYFTTLSEIPTPPFSPILVSPINGATGVIKNPTLQVTVNDPNNDVMKVSFFSSNGTLIGIVNNVASGSSPSIVWSGRSYLTLYSWYVVVNDSVYNTTSSTWSFTTAANQPPTSPVLVQPTPGQTNVSINPILQVTVNDPNNDVMKVSFFSSNGTLIGIVNNVASGSSPSVVWSGRSYSTTYSWYVVVNDSVYNTTSSTWSFTTGSFANNPPFIPSHPEPVNHATSIDVNINLHWLGGDPDCGNIVTYDIYFGTNSNPPLVKSDHTNISYDPGIMNDTTKYYWQIIAKDNHGAITAGPIWDFTTVYINQPPNLPYNPTPEEGKTSVDIDQNLYWSGGDPDGGDIVTYDVYFGYILPIQKIASNISTPTYDPGTLTKSLTYFWKIVAWDSHGLSTNGPIWYFKTINATNSPPNKPLKPSGFTSGKIGTTHSYSSSTTDPNGDYIYYWFDWGDGTNSGWDGPHYSGDNITLAHSWTRIGTYPIKVKAKDIYGNESVWSDPLVISMPKIKISNLILQLLYKTFNHFPIIEKTIQRFLMFEKILNQDLMPRVGI